MSTDNYLSMTELATIVGGTSYTVGRCLTEAGLRSNGRPTGKAFASGMVKQAPTGRGSGYFYKWHQEKTVPYLKGKDGGKAVK